MYNIDSFIEDWKHYRSLGYDARYIPVYDDCHIDLFCKRVDTLTAERDALRQEVQDAKKPYRERGVICSTPSYSNTGARSHSPS